MTDRNHQPPDLLEQAIAGLRDAPIPDGPPPRLVASTVEALEYSLIPPDVVRLLERRRKMIRIARYSSAAAVAAALVVVVGTLLMLRPVPAFADVVQGKERGVLRQKVYVQGDVYRMELPSAQEGVTAPADAPPILLVVIVDFKQKKALQIDYTKKTAKFIKGEDQKWEEMAKAFANPLEQLRDLKGDDAKPLGEEEWNGSKTAVFKLKKKDVFLGMRLTAGETAKLWVDVKSGLPVRIAVEPAADSKEKAPLLVFEQFAWNEALDAALFKLEAPKGFTVEGE
jgi:hypothetical protein